MSQTDEAVSMQQLLDKMNDSIAALQDAQQTVVEGAALLGEHKNDPEAHGAVAAENIAKAIAKPKWEGTKLSFASEDGKVSTEPVDLKGNKGDPCSTPDYKWEGTSLKIQNPDGSWPDAGTNLQGPPGNITVSNAVDSTDESTAASSLAVKTVNDAVTSARGVADAAQTTANEAKSAAASAQGAAEAAQSRAEAAYTKAEQAMSGGADWTASKPGIVSRVETLEEKTKPFTPPTESAPGQAGLVPGPGATGEIPPLLRYLAADADWGEFSRHNFAADPTVANGRELVLAGTSHPEGLDANTLAYGTYISVALRHTPTESGTLIAIPTFRSKDSYGVTQLWFSYGYPVAYRTTLSSLSVPLGSLPKAEHWGPWGSLGAAIPTSVTGLGQWVALNNNLGGNTITLPGGGVWAYHAAGYNGNASYMHSGDHAGTVAGGTTIKIGNSSTEVRGFAWRIA